MPPSDKEPTHTYTCHSGVTSWTCKHDRTDEWHRDYKANDFAALLGFDLGLVFREGREPDEADAHVQRRSLWDWIVENWRGREDDNLR